MANRNNRLNQKERAYEAYLAQFPDWYWTRSLHDARILSVETDIAYIPDESRPFDNCLVLQIDSEGCYEDDVLAIYLCNYTSDTDDLHLLDASWWLGDTLSGSDGDWCLNLTVDTAEFVEKTVDIHFEFAHVKRTGK